MHYISVISENVTINHILLKSRFFGPHSTSSIVTISPKIYCTRWNNAK